MFLKTTFLLILVDIALANTCPRKHQQNLFCQAALVINGTPLQGTPGSGYQIVYQVRVNNVYRLGRDDIKVKVGDTIEVHTSRNHVMSGVPLTLLEEFLLSGDYVNGKLYVNSDYWNEEFSKLHPIDNHNRLQNFDCRCKIKEHGETIKESEKSKYCTGYPFLDFCFEKRGYCYQGSDGSCTWSIKGQWPNCQPA